MSVTRNWYFAKVIQCDECGHRAPLWKAVLSGSGWKVRPRHRSEPQHCCPTCSPSGTTVQLGHH